MPLRPPVHRAEERKEAQRERKRRHDAFRGTSRERGYTRQWEKARAAFLTEHPLCVRCRENGILNDGTRRIDGSYEPNANKRGLVVDHIIPHRGDPALFWGPENWEVLCRSHHDREKQAIEARARSRAVETDPDPPIQWVPCKVGVSGMQLDPGYPGQPGGGGSKVREVCLGTGGSVKLSRPRNSDRGVL